MPLAPLLGFAQRLFIATLQRRLLFAEFRGVLLQALDLVAQRRLDGGRAAGGAHRHRFTLHLDAAVLRRRPQLLDVRLEVLVEVFAADAGLLGDGLEGDRLAGVPHVLDGGLNGPALADALLLRRGPQAAGVSGCRHGSCLPP